MEGVVPLLQGLKPPILVSNINADQEPSFKGKYKKSTVVEVGGRKIGIIGYMTVETPVRSSLEHNHYSYLKPCWWKRNPCQASLSRFEWISRKVIAHTGKLLFENEEETIAEEARRLHEAGVNIIIALGHSGYKKDLRIAEIPYIDVVVGAHTHTFLYNGKMLTYTKYVRLNSNQ